VTDSLLKILPTGDPEIDDALQHELRKQRHRFQIRGTRESLELVISDAILDFQRSVQDVAKIDHRIIERPGTYTVGVEFMVRVDGDIARCKEMGDLAVKFFAHDRIARVMPAGVQLYIDVLVRRDGPDGDVDEAAWRLGGSIHDGVMGTEGEQS